MGLSSGKVKWFSPDQQLGVVVGVGGNTLLFSSHNPGDDAKVNFSEGQLVSYADLGRGRLGQRAGAVRGLRGRAVERQHAEPPFG